jgi:hypothetical protein
MSNVRRGIAERVADAALPPVIDPGHVERRRQDGRAAVKGRLIEE